MANNLLTTQKIVDRALAVLTETPSFLKMINTQYDDQFGYKGGAKVGDTVSVRVPQRATIRTGRIMDIQAQVDKVIPVKIDTYKGVDTGATSAEMAMQIDDYQAQFIDTKIPDLVTAVEADVMSRVIPLVPASVGTFGAYNSAGLALSAGAYLDSQLAPKDGREMLVNTYSQVDIIGALSGFFNDQNKVGSQYKTGRMGLNTLGFDWDSSNLTPYVTRGTANGGYLVNGATQSGSSLIVDTGTGTINIGDSFTIAGVFDVHPQTKVTLAGLKQFTVTAAYAGGGGTLAITPAIVGPGSSEQNVSALPADNAAITVKGTSGVTYAENVAFSKDAFYFVTADLPNPQGLGVQSASRSWKGITLRFMNGFDITNDMYVSRFDIVYGAGILRPELAVRIPATYTGI